MTSQTFAAVFGGGIAGSRRMAVRVLILVPAMLAFGLTMPLWGQTQDAGVRERKLITRIEPQYPATLERLYIGGVVRLQVVVAANGTVQGATLIGGNPILGQAAIAAVKQWKYAPGGNMVTITERLEFDPHH